MEYDVIVSGLGPAGCSFLKSLEGSGLKVLAIDKEEFPRLKPCAGGLTKKAYGLLKGLFPDLDSVIRVSSRILRLYYDGKSSKVYSEEVLTYLTERKELDWFLFKNILGEFTVKTGIKSLGVERDGSSVLLKTNYGTFRCKVLIVSEGVNSRVVSQLSVKRELGFTYEAYIEGNYGEDVFVDFSRFTWGYFWGFPKGDYVTVGVGEFKSKKVFKSLKELLYQFNSKHGFNGRVLWERGFPIPAGREKNDVYREGILLLGDSGGLVDPLTGEGIYYGVKSGILAAKVVKEAFKRGNFSLLREYKEKVDREMGEEFKWARRVGKLFFPFRGFNFYLLERSPSLSRLAAKLLSGELSYREGFTAYLKAAPFALLKR
ncbi:geranylgeranyl reductase family protein [Thermovibrio sp.]